MATTTYFEVEYILRSQSPSSRQDRDPDTSSPKNTVEVYVSSFSGTPQLYLKHIDADGNEVDSVLDENID